MKTISGVSFPHPLPCPCTGRARGPSQGMQQGALSPLCCLGGGAREELGLTCSL